jgi:hypothetical protein
VSSTGFALMNGTNPRQKFDCMGNRKADFSELSTCQCKFGFFLSVFQMHIFIQKHIFAKIKVFFEENSAKRDSLSVANFMPLQKI